MTLARGEGTRAVLAFAVVYVVWGTTYLAIAWALRGGLPPFAAACLRFVLASGLMCAWLRLRDARPFEGLPLARVAASGVLMLGGGNGLTVWAQQGVPSGIAALVVAATPLVMMLMDWLAFERRAPSSVALAGALVGLSGIALTLAHTRSLAGSARPIHLASLVSAVLCWSAGSLLLRGRVPRGRLAAATCLQMAAGAAVLALMALADGDWRRLHWAAVTPLAWASLLYLSLAGSILALVCYQWLLAHVGAQKAITYALVNPLVALVLGAWVLGEALTGTVGMACLLVLAGVALVLLQGRRAT